MRARAFYKQQTKFDRNIGRKPCDGKQSKDDAQFIVDYLDRAKDLDLNLRNSRMEDGFNWILGFHNYIKDKEGTLSSPLAYHNYPVGTIVLCDLFGHFGTELTYEHPALTLVDNYDSLIILPISSSCYGDNINTHIDLARNVPTLGGLRRDSAIKVEQIRFISKKRILQKFGRVTDNFKLMEINRCLTEYLMPLFYNGLIDEQEKNYDELFEKDEIISVLETELMSKIQTIAELELVIKKMQEEKEESSTTI